MRSDNTNIRYLSLSAKGIEALLPVQLDSHSPVTQSFNATFYPGGARREAFDGALDGEEASPKRKKKQERGAERGHYFELVQYLAQVSSYLNSTFAQLRYMTKEAQYVTQDSGTTVADNFKRLLFVTDADMLLSATRNFMEIAGSGKMHILKPSTVMPGGFDIVYSGIPGKAVGDSACLSMTKVAERHGLPQVTYSLEHKRFEEKVYTSDYAKMSMEKATQILQALLGKDTKAGNVLASHLRQSGTIPINFDFKSILNKIVNDDHAKRTVGTSELCDYSDFPKIPEYLMAGLGKYFSILVNVEPNPEQVNFAYSNSSQSPSENKQPVSTEYLTLQPDLTFSIVAHIPKEVCEYITQTPTGERIPLVPLNTWATVWSRGLLRVPKSRGGLPIRSLPRYVLPASATKKLNDARTQLGFYTEAGRSNDDDMFVSNTGRLNYCPKSADLALDNATNYEALLEEALSVSFQAGSPLNTNLLGETHKCFSLAYPEYKEKINKLKGGLKRYAGCLQAYSWDYNCILTSAIADPDKLVAINLSGTTRPDELGLSDYLKKPFAESMALLFNSSIDPNTKKQVTKDVFGGNGQCTSMLGTTIFTNFYSLYQYLFQKGLVPTLQDLVTSASVEMGISSLDPTITVTSNEAAQYEFGLYSEVLNTNLHVTSQYSSTTPTTGSASNLTRGIDDLLERALRDSYGAPRSNLAKMAQRNSFDLVDDPHYFSPEHFTLAEFKNIYNYLGGRVFLNAIKAVQKVDKKALFVVDTVPTVENMVPIPNFAALVKEVMPLVYILGKYVIDSDDIYEKAEVISESNKRATSIGVDDIRIAGSKIAVGNHSGFQMFPHQVEANQYLRGTPPRFAILDVAPGGGKTTLLLADIAALANDGLIKRPCVLAPNGLVKNWVEDMVKVTNGTWNMIPITTMTYRTWGDERLTKMISTAPRNTVVVIGFSVTKLDQYPIVIGNHVEQTSSTLEFLKKFGFDYIAIDESHKLKNASSGIHKAAKQLCVSSAAKYIRLATGTLISNKLTDVVGQAALFNPQIFRTAEEYEAENSEPAGDNSRATVWKDNTASLARQQLSKHCSVITFKRKEWAFMLPRPMETFIPVNLEKEERDGGDAHYLMYEAILKETLESIEKDQSIQKLLAGKDDDSDSDDDGEEDAKKRGSRVAADADLVPPDDLDDATMEELQQQLNPYLARLEQLLTDPLGDPFGEIYFKDIEEGSFISNKVLKIIERIRLNFVDFPWEKGKSYGLKDLADYDGLRYVLMGRPGEKLTLASYEEKYTSTITPNKDPRWQEESRGKVIVFCRYTRTVNAIYKYLPADLKKLSVKFTGEEKDKEAGLNAFKTHAISKDKGVQILIANEQGMTEGHNLQMANRLIRVESPWAPGDLDQAAARIFRPDPSHEFKRETIYLDWIVTNNTIEFTKMGRLISKMVSKTQFDEADNPLYDAVKEFKLPLIRMSLATIKEVNNRNAIQPYIEAYQTMAYTQAAEFEEMRQTKPSTMLDIEATSMFADSGIIEHVPYIPDLKIFDRHNLGLIKLKDYLDDTDNSDAVDIVNDKKKLIGRYVHTEFGNGVVIGIVQTGRDGREAGSLRKLSRVEVQLASGDLYKPAASLVYLATDLTAENIKDFTPTSPWSTKRDKSRAERIDKQVARQLERDTRSLERIKLRELKELARLREARTAVRQPRTPRVPKDVGPTSVELYSVIYNGFLAVEATHERDSDRTLETYGYKAFGEYAYIKVPDAASFDAIMDFLDKSFDYSPDTLRRLTSVANTFEVHDSKGSATFNPTLATTSEFKLFYSRRHVMSGVNKKTGEPILKIYPVVMNGELLLNIDLSTNPAITKVLGKRIRGCLTKFDDASGFHIKFFSNKSELVRHVKELRAAGIVISNYEDLKDEVRTMNYKKGML